MGLALLFLKPSDPCGLEKAYIAEMDVLLVVLGALAVLVGIAGCVLPFLPGPPIAWVGLLLLHFSKYASFSNRMLVVTAAITIVLVLLDFFLPVLATKPYGGTKAGLRGATAGTIIGLFFGPAGILLGPFVGAFVGEVIARPREVRRALRAALGSFAGFLLTLGLKLVWCLLMAWWFLQALWA